MTDKLYVGIDVSGNSLVVGLVDATSKKIAAACEYRNNRLGTEKLVADLVGEEVAATDVEDLVVFVVEHSKNRFSDPKEVVKKLEAVARQSYRIRLALAKSLNFGISNHFGQHSGVANLTD